MNLILVKSELAYPDPNKRFRAISIQLGSTIDNHQDKTTINYMDGETHPILTITSLFEYGLTEKRFNAFLKRIEERKGTIMITQPDDSLIENFIMDNSAEWNKPNNYLKLLRWVANEYFEPIIPNLTWSLDGERWFPMYYMNIIGVELVQTYEFREDEYLSLLNAGAFEPLPFDLLKEAEKLIHASPRSSIILLAAALEVGVKKFIASKEPNTGWILDNSQSPPIDKLINEYLFKIEPRLNFNNVTKQSVKTLVNERNNLVHSGTIDRSVIDTPETWDFKSEKNEKVLRRFGLVRDILYLLARYSGQAWVLDQVHVRQSRTI